MRGGGWFRLWRICSSRVRGKNSRIYFNTTQKVSWSGTSYCRIHFLPFTRDGRGYAQHAPFINLWTSYFANARLRAIVFFSFCFFTLVQGGTGRRWLECDLGSNCKAARFFDLFLANKNKYKIHAQPLGINQIVF